MIASDPTDLAIALLIVVPGLAAVALVLARRLQRRLLEMERAIDPVFVGIDLAPDGSVTLATAWLDDAGHIRVESTPIISPRAAERRRTDAEARVLAEMEAEHESLSARPERVAAAEALIDRIFPDPSVPKGER